MASNTSLEELKRHLFATLEGLGNLNDKEADDRDKCTTEQAKAIVDVADAIIDIYKVQVNAVEIVGKMNDTTAPQVMLEMGVIEKEGR